MILRSTCIIGLLWITIGACNADPITTYKSAYNDFDYTAPAGWYFKSTDTNLIVNDDGAVKIDIAPQRISGTTPFLLVVSSYYYQDSISAREHAYRLAFGMGKIASVFQKTIAPSVRTVQDTVISGTHYIGTEVTTTGSANVAYFQLRGKRLISLNYWTTDTDWDSNRNEYYQHFYNAGFHQGQPVAAKQSAAPVGVEPKRLFWDLLGRVKQGSSLQAGVLNK